MEQFNPVLSLEEANTTEDELACLQRLRYFLSPREELEQGEQQEDDIDSVWLKQACNGNGDNNNDILNPFPHKTPQEVLKDQEQLNKFTFYLFERRYGWSEHVSFPDMTIFGKDGCRPDSRSGRPTSLNIEGKLKGRLNELLDDFLKWYLCQNCLSVNLLQSLVDAVSKASNLPVVRNQTVVHVLEWLKTLSTEGFEPESFVLIKKFIVAGLTDVWSAIRNASTARLPRIIDNLTLVQLEVLYNQLGVICQSKESSWQAKEGAVMGLTTIIRSFHVTNLPIITPGSSSSPKFQMFVKFGDERLPKLPEFITDSLYSVVFTLLANPQLSIREHASKAFTSILSRCESQYIEKSFQQVIIHLCRDTGVDTSSQNYEILPHHAVVNHVYKFLDAYEAQGLLEVSLFLIKRIPVKLLMERWSLYFSTFNLYLMHPASTVRQASSEVFKYFVTKDSSSPSILRLVLQSLASHWETRPSQTVENGPTIRSKGQNVNQCLNSSCAHYFGQCKCCTSQTGVPSSKRPSIKSISKLYQDIDKPNLDLLLSSTWEWREGRLLAYELILKYLITNHIHYVFPSYAFTYSSRQATCSVDESVLRRAKEIVSPQTYSSKDTSCNSLPSSKSMEILEEGQNVSGRSSAPGTRKEKDETFISKSCGTGTRYRDRASSFSKKDFKPRLVRNRTVGGLIVKTLETPTLNFKMFNNNIFADSLLNRAKLMDFEEQKPSSNKANSTCKEYERFTKETNISVKWMTSSHLDSIHRILSQILYQTIQSMGDTRWELRRMAQQILPLITETIRWFDITILEEFWSKYLSRSHPLFCYSGCMALKYSISHAGKLQNFITQPPATWKDIESCCSSAMNVARSVDNGLQLWIPKVLNLLTNISSYDKITIIALDVLLTREAFLPQDARAKQKHSTDVLICEVIISLFLKAHPNSFCAMSLKNLPTGCSVNNQDRASFYSSDEFLSITSKSVTLPEQARQAERALFHELHSLIPLFLGNCSFNIQITLLPVLVHSVHSFCDDTTISHSLVQSIIKVVDGLQENHDSENFVDKSQVDLFLDLAIWEFSFLMTQRSIDLTILKQLQEIFLNVFKHIDRPSHIKDVLQALSTRLNYEPDLVRLMTTSGGSDDNDSDDDDVPLAELQLLSNDIPTSPVGDSPLLQDDDDDDMHDDSVERIVHESLALNSSHDSLVNATNDEAGADSDEAFSDWDSCDEPVTDNTREAFSEFVCKIARLFQEKQNGYEYFEEELKKCGHTDEMIIQSIL